MGSLSSYFRVVFICHFTQEDSKENFSSLFSLTCTLLTYWLWTSTEHDTDTHDLFTIITVARGCTVSLGCSRRLDHGVIKMDLWPSFSQPNVRENQPLKLIAANFIAGRSQPSLSQIVGANCSQKAKILCCFKPSFSYQKASSNMSNNNNNNNNINNIRTNWRNMKIYWSVLRKSLNMIDCFSYFSCNTLMLNFLGRKRWRWWWWHGWWCPLRLELEWVVCCQIIYLKSFCILKLYFHLLLFREMLCSCLGCAC